MGSSLDRQFESLDDRATTYPPATSPALRTNRLRAVSSSARGVADFLVSNLGDTILPPPARPAPHIAASSRLPYRRHADRLLPVPTAHHTLRHGWNKKERVNRIIIRTDYTPAPSLRPPIDQNRRLTAPSRGRRPSANFSSLQDPDISRTHHHGRAADVAAFGWLNS